nr:HepT-like ribonuclease domain-containing protein [uncultured Desulfobacter sp.]
MAELTERIRVRFKEVTSVSELTDSFAGVEKLDLLLMPLIVIGELVTKIDHITKQALFKKYPQTPWREIKGLRNVVAHNYYEVNAEEIFDTCKNDIPKLAKTIKQIISDFQ